MNESSTRVTFEQLGWLTLACWLVGCAEPAEYPYPAPPPPPPPPAVEPEPLPEPYTQPAPPGAPPSSLTDAGAPPTMQPSSVSAANASASSAAAASASSAGLVATYPTGQWVYLVDEGWVWVPQGTVAVDLDGIPYAFLYTPVLGWTWYVSPWGWGPYFYGPWFRHPWHPYGWHGYWVGHPNVIERLGPRGGGRGHR